MEIRDIYQAVRLCFDEGAENGSSLSEEAVAALGSDSEAMNEIIENKLSDALRWVCLYAPAEQLSGGGSGESGTIDIIEDSSGDVPSDGRISLGGNFIRLIRIRCSDWQRAVMGDSLLKEDSEEYLQLSDPYGAEATSDRPQAALIETREKQVEVWPHGSEATYELTKLVMPTSETIRQTLQQSGEVQVSVPPLLEGSFVYYLAFLVLSAYADPRATRMLEIAKMNLGLTDDKQRA